MDEVLRDQASVPIHVDSTRVVELLEESLRSEKIVLLSEEVFLSLLSDKTRLRILNILARGPLKASEIARSLGITRTLVYKHLRALEEYGVVEKTGRFYRLSSTIFMAYRVSTPSEGPGVSIVLDDKIAFIDHRYGIFFILVDKSLVPLCRECLVYDSCDRDLTELARKYRVRIDRESLPAYKITDILVSYIRRNISRYLSGGYIVLRKR